MRDTCDKRTAIDYAFGACVNLEEAEIYAPKAKTAGHLSLNNTKLRSFSWFVPELENAEKAFDNTVLSKESAIDMLKALPTWNDGKTHAVSLGIHTEHQNDDEVWTAIYSTEVKGWQLTIKWNPGGPTYTTPEASTFAMGTLIYAKVGEMERHDGTTEQFLDWGHYVTNWEERGYEQFRSVEAAREYFNLPTEDLTSQA